MLTTHSEPSVTCTPYEGIARLPPGVTARLVGEKLEFEPVYTAPIPETLAPLGERGGRIPRAGKPATQMLADLVRTTVAGAVSRAMAGVRRVAVMAGGGVDSSAILALAMQEARRRGDVEVIPVALDFEGPGDDRPHLRALAAHLGITPVRVPPRAASAHVRDMFVADAAPFTWPSGALERALCVAAIESGAERILTGAGGDDLFDGDPNGLARFALSAPLSTLRSVAGLVVPWETSARQRLKDFVVRPLIAPLVPRSIREGRRRRHLDEAYPWAGPVLRSAIDDMVHAPRPLAAHDAAARYRKIATSAHLAEVGTMRVQLEVASRLSRVDPYLDPEVIALAARLEPSALFAGDRMRGLFREAMRGLLPESVRLRTDKASFDPAQAAMVEGAGGFEAFRDLASVTMLADLGLVEPRRYRQSFDALAEKPTDGDWLGVWPVLAIEAFLRSAGKREAK